MSGKPPPDSKNNLGQHARRLILLVSLKHKGPNLAQPEVPFSFVDLQNTPALESQTNYKSRPCGLFVSGPGLSCKTLFSRTRLRMALPECPSMCVLLEASKAGYLDM